jgi:hypothetical protein
MSNGKIQIIVAVIGLVGALGAAYINLVGTEKLENNTDKHNNTNSYDRNNSSREKQNQIPDIDGYWRDSIYPSNTSKIRQNGNIYSFSADGFLNGIKFTSSGNGTITGNIITSKYRTRYLNGSSSTSGACSGTISSDTMRIVMSCRDQYLGTYPLTSIRD